MPGKVITVEGGDGVGKTTFVKLLEQHIKSRGFKVQSKSFPDYISQTGNLISMHLNNQLSLNPWLAGIIYASDRREWVWAIKEDLESGYSTILNRGVFSNLAYQSARLQHEEEKRELQKYLLELEYELNGFPKSDFTLYLDLPPEIASARTESRGAGQDVYERDMALRKAVREEYYSIFQRHPQGVIEVKCYNGEKIFTPEEVLDVAVGKLTQDGFFDSLEKDDEDDD